MRRSTSVWMIGAAFLIGPPVRADLVVVSGLESVNGTQLWVQRMGSGEPIIVVHGGPVLEHGYLLRHLAPLAEGYEMIFFDQRLSGRSAPEVDESTVRLANFTEDIEALRVALGLERIHLMAHSWGGLLAMHYAVRYESNLRSLILLDSMAASSALWQQEQGLLGGMITEEDKAERQAIMATEAFAERRPEAIEALLRFSFKMQFHDRAKVDGLELYVPEDYSERSRRFGKLGPELEDFDLHDELKGLAVPTLILYGDAEPGAALGGAAIHEAIQDSEFVMIENAGHFPFIEQSDAFLSAVRKFLAGVEADADGG